MIPVANLIIPEWLIYPRPDQEIIIRKMGIPILIGSERYFQSCAEIEQEISENSFYYP